MNQVFSGSREEKRRFTFLMCVSCLAINIIGAKISEWLGLPLYLDAIGTVLSATLGGLIPGIIVGFVTNLFFGALELIRFGEGYTWYYGCINVLIAICSSAFARKDFFRKPKTWPIMILVYTLIGGALGSALTYFLYYSYEEVRQVADVAKVFWGIKADELTDFIRGFGIGTVIDLADKTITVLAVAMLLRLLPEELRKQFYFSGWRQAPVSAKVVAKENRGFRRRSLRFKVILVVALATLVTGMSVTTISFIHFRKSAIEQQQKLAQGTVNVVAGSFLPEHVDDYIQCFNGNEESKYLDEYLHAEEVMRSLMKSSEYIDYCYVYRITPEGCVVVFDPDITGRYEDAVYIATVAAGSENEEERQKLVNNAQAYFEELDDYRNSAERAVNPVPPDGADIAGVGSEPYTEAFDEDFLDKVPALLAGEKIDPRDVRSRYGWYMTFYEPVYDENGVCRCYAGVDVSMDHIAQDGHRFLARVISLFFGFFVIILAVAIWLAEYNVILPINSMAAEANRSSYETEEDRTAAIANIEKLDIRTRDEIENLYTAMVRTTKDMAQTTDSMAKAIAETQRQHALIGKMQNGLILVLADMVESRDQNTGEHVRKTAAYTGVIMRELRREHIYEDQLTDAFIQDVMNSAPLHDVGKIQVPDQILNKPGKLDDNEFATMKTHTTAGSEIITSAMDMVSEGGSGYLKEARNLAKYHHEKWNGMGYPEGLKGEEIPLSARIMAVADVFDALVSKRSYKDGFPFEKAMAIIEEGSGSHFDPNVAGAFIRASDEVREIMNSQMMGRDNIGPLESEG